MRINSVFVNTLELYFVDFKCKSNILSFSSVFGLHQLTRHM